MQKILSTLLFSLVSFHALAEQVPGQTLLSYFQANCRSQGEWTKSALADSAALIETLNSIKNDPDCKSVSGSIANLNMLTSQLTALQNVSDTQKKISEINYQEQELLMQLSQTTAVATKDTINQKLRDFQLERAGLYGQENAKKDLASPTKAQAMIDTIKVANTAFTQLASNQECLGKNPGILNTASTMMAAVGATAMATNPALGLGLTAGSALLGTTIQGVKDYKNARDIRKISDFSIAYEGYKCALETMSDKWCQMKDAEAFIDFKISSRLSLPTGSDLGKAIRLNDREIPVLLDWLNKIKSGVPATTTADANRQSTVFSRESMLRSIAAYGIGLIEQNRPLYLQATTREDKWNIVKRIVNNIAPGSTSDSMTSNRDVSNPLYDVISSRGYAPFYLLGVSDGPKLQVNGVYIVLDNWEGGQTYVPDIDLVKSKFLSWVSDAQNLVNQEMTQILQPDSLQTLTSAYDRSGNRWKLSPMDSLKNLVTFLEKNPPRESDYAFKKIYKSTLISLTHIYDVAQAAVIDEAAVIYENKRSPVEEVYETAQLKYGTVVLQTRLDLIVRIALLELIETSPQADQDVVAQILAAERFTDAISRVSGTENLSVIRQDIQNAQPITISNLNAFAKFFGDSISKILFNLYKEEMNNTGTVARAKRNARTKMCFLLLSVPNAYNQVNLNYCTGLQLGALVPGGPSSPVISLDLYRKDLNDRACTYRDYFRHNRIFENWGIRP